MNGNFRAMSRKDFRELLPWAAAVAATVLACAYIGQFLDYSLDAERFQAAGIGAYFLGVVSLGAMSVGHEYSHRTLPALLAQPVERWRVLAAKLSALTPIVAVLTLIVLAAPWREPGLDYRTLVTAAVPTALFIAPWFALLSRSTLAGAVLSAAIPTVCMVLPGSIFSWFDRTTLTIGFVSGVSAASAIMIWWTFLRLQSSDGASAEVSPSAWLQRMSGPALLARGRSDSLLWQVFAKELRLQQLTLFVGGLYVVSWFAMAGLRKLPVVDADFNSVSTIYSGLISILAGALAIAEERHIGTADWQRLQPISSRRLFAIKLSMAVMVAFGLATFLPAVLRTLAPGALNFRQDALPWILVMLLFGSALYLSSISQTGIRAVLGTLPAVAGTAFLFQAIVGPWSQSTHSLTRQLAAGLVRILPSFHMRLAGTNFSEIFLLLFVAVLIGFAYANYRSGERSETLLRRQLPWIGVALLVAITVVDIAFRVVQLQTGVPSYPR